MTPADVRDAAHRIRPLAKRTPVMTSAGFDAEAGINAFFKCENLQKGGAFKIRGAANLIFSLPKESLEQRRGGIFVGQSRAGSGDCGAARRRAGDHRDARRRAALEAGGDAGARGQIVTFDRMRESRETIAANILKETGAALVPPFDHPMIMAGQGTAALELLEEAPNLDALITPVGGGGLLSGCATIAKDINPKIRIFGAEPEDGNDTFLSMLAGDGRDPDAEDDCRRAALHQTRRTDVPGDAEAGGADHRGERRRNPRSGEVSAATDENPGGAERRGGRGRGAVQQAAAGRPLRGRGSFGRQRRSRAARNLLRRARPRRL